MARAGGLRQLGVAGGSFGGAYEARETIDVGEAIGAGLVIGLAGRVAQAGDFVGPEAAGDAHFVEIGVGREGQKAGMLVLPTEAANGRLARGLEDWNRHDPPPNLVFVFLTFF